MCDKTQIKRSAREHGPDVRNSIHFYYLFLFVAFFAGYSVKDVIDSTFHHHGNQVVVQSWQVKQVKQVQHSEPHVSPQQPKSNLNGTAKLADVALCIVGLGSHLKYTAPWVQKHVIKSLKADVFLSIFDTSEDPSYIDKFRPPNGRRLRVAKFGKDFDIENWYYETADRKGKKDELIKFLKEPVIYSGAALSGILPETVGHGGDAQHRRHVCREMILEEEEKTKQKYKYIRIIRTDLNFTAPDMPPNYISPNQTTCFINCVKADYQGYCDTNAFCTRTGGLAYLSGVETVIHNSKSLMEIHKKNTKRHCPTFKTYEEYRKRLDWKGILGTCEFDGTMRMQGEGLLFAILRHHKVRILRAPSNSYLMCPCWRAYGCSSKNTGFSKCMFDEERRVGYRQWVSDHGKVMLDRTFVVSDHIARCGWSKNIVNVWNRGKQRSEWLASIPNLETKLENCFN